MTKEIEAAYSTLGRAYHSYQHVLEVVARWNEVARDVGWTRPRESYVAVLYHDAVYLPGRADNEAASAELARDAIARLLPDVDTARVVELILLTARHSKLQVGDVDGEAALFLDCDMAIIGAPAERYDQYERAVAVEYQSLPAELYRAGRRHFLQTLDASPRIFLSDYFHARLDGAARENLKRTLQG